MNFILAIKVIIILYLHTQTLIDADDLLESANVTALDAWEAFTVRNQTISNITSVSRNNQLELEALNSSIESLQLQLQRAFQAAASVCLI